jgi:hypothetical protein
MSVFKKLFYALIAGRQASANFKIAQLLQRSEFPNESVEHILARIQNGDIYGRHS